MPYKISGTKSETARILVIKESDWTIESNSIISGSGGYEVLNLSSGRKIVVALGTGGETVCYGYVNAISY
jgi:hypothetical protein